MRGGSSSNLQRVQMSQLLRTPEQAENAEKTVNAEGRRAAEGPSCFDRSECIDEHSAALGPSACPALPLFSAASAPSAALAAR